jgi:nucleoside-diphosphate-sugar epimerase
MALFVTGGSGFLGSRIVQSLIAGGDPVFALSRSGAADAALAALGAAPVRGDLDGSPLALPPIRAVVHAAAHFRLAGPRAPFFRTNVEGTRALIAAARAAGAERFVFISAAGVVMDDHGSVVRQVDETAPVFPDSFSPYIASKAQAERIVLAADAPGFRTLALRPPGIWGRGDVFSKMLPTLLRRRQFGFIDGGRYPFATCHVDNVVEAVVRALRSEAHGKAYFVNDREPTTFRAFALDVAKAQGLDASRAPSFPYEVARAAGALMEGLWTLAGARGDPPMSRTMTRLIGREFTTSDAAARRDLGYVGERLRAEGLAHYA